MRLFSSLKKSFLLLLAVAFSATTFAVNPPDEGMWLPMFIKNYNYAEMQHLGLHLTPEQLYDINHSSLKDAIVQLGDGFCTGEMVSKDGLMFTNHHCGYSSVVELSTMEHDYLTNGFFAMSKKDELPANFHVNFLERMEDVTEIVLADVTTKMSESDRQKTIKSAIDKLKKDNSENGRYKVVVKSFYEGNEYYMFIYTTYEDVRLVVAPPSAIGKFGGDTDNWMWPRHTGDFSMFRVYANQDNLPANYSKNNRPYQPKKHLEISLDGVKEGDFTFVFGYPGTTQRYVTGDAVQLAANIENPIRIDLRTIRLKHYNKAMNQSAAQRLKYASRVASIANGWKKWQGETLGINRLNGVEKKREFEQRFQQWAADKPQYYKVLSQLKEDYDYLRPIEVELTYFSEAVRASDFMNRAASFCKLAEEDDELRVSGSASKL